MVILIILVASNSGLSTGLIQYCVNPYITKIEIPESQINEADPLIRLSTLTFLGRQHITDVKASDLTISKSRPFSSWTLKKDAASDQRVAKKIGFLPKFKRSFFYVHTGLMQDDPNLESVYRMITGLKDAKRPTNDVKFADNSWDQKVKELRMKQAEEKSK